MKNMNANSGLYQIIIFSALCLYSASFAYASNLRMAKACKARMHIEHISTAIELFKLDAGKYPTQHQGLSALYEEPSDIKFSEKWNGPYMGGKKNHVPADSWGNPFIYRYPGRYNLKSYDLYSLGEDGKSESNGNDADDISNWNSKETWKDYYKMSIGEKVIIFIICFLTVLYGEF